MARLSIEFFGMPASGKSTTLARVADVISQKGIQVDHRTYILSHHTCRLKRVAIKASRVLKELLLHPAYALRSTFIILQTRQQGFSDLVKVLFNWIFVSSLYRQSVSAQALRLIDEGVFQALWSIAFSARGDWAFMVRGLMDMMPMPTVLAIVETSLPNIEHRVKTRLRQDSRLDRYQVEERGLLEKAARIIDEIRANLVLVSERHQELCILKIKNDQLEDLDMSVTRIIDTIELWFQRSAERWIPPLPARMTRGV